jgi:hypothetical protein
VSILQLVVLAISDQSGVKMREKAKEASAGRYGI